MSDTPVPPGDVTSADKAADKAVDKAVDKAKADIAVTRAALAETAAALKVKSDVKTRLTATIKANQTVLAAVGGGVALVVVVRAIASRRSSKKKGKKR